MTHEELIDSYARGPDLVRDALATVSLDVRPAADEWTPREIVHHLADAELQRALRFRRLLTEDDPLFEEWPENEYADRLFYMRPIETSLRLLEAVVGSNVELMHEISESDWLRTARHTQFGEITIHSLLVRAGEHMREHASQISSCEH